MTRSIQQLFKTIQTQGTLLSHQETDSKTGVTHFWSSTFIKEKGLLVRGESYNPRSSKRNAMIVLYHPKTGQVKGGSGDSVCLSPKAAG